MAAYRVFLCGGPAAGRLDTASDCPDRWRHLLQPNGMMEAMGWAEDIIRTHTGHYCPGCSKHYAWTPRARFVRVVERAVNRAIEQQVGPGSPPWTAPEARVVGPGVYVRVWGDLLDPVVEALGQARFHVFADPETTTVCVLGRWAQ